LLVGAAFDFACCAAYARLISSRGWAQSPPSPSS
jgi:hypothetical protein